MSTNLPEVRKRVSKKKLSLLFNQNQQKAYDIYHDYVRRQRKRIQERHSSSASLQPSSAAKRTPVDVRFGSRSVSLGGSDNSDAASMESLDSS